MKSLKSILQGRPRQSSFGRGVDAALVVAAGNKILASEFGEEVKNHALAVYYKNQKLAVACLSSTVAQEIRLREKQLLKALNNNSNLPPVKKFVYLS